jgi:hypothetical protein
MEEALKQLRSKFDRGGDSYTVEEVVSRDVFNVDVMLADGTTPRFVVNLTARTCSCNEWQHNRFVCLHAVVACSRGSLDVYNYIDEKHTAKNWKDMYTAAGLDSFPAPLMPSACPPVNFGTPLKKTATANKPAGRPHGSKANKKRRKGALDAARGELPPAKRRCSVCRMPGHRKKSVKCKGNAGARQMYISSNEM